MIVSASRRTDIPAFYSQWLMKRLEAGPAGQGCTGGGFRALSRRCGKQRVIWRYDPVFLDQNHTISWHLQQFERLCQGLADSTCRCVFSFIDLYRGSKFRAMTRKEMEAVAAGFSQIAKEYGLPLFTCAEAIDLSAWGIGHSACIDRGVIEAILGCPIAARKDKNQRPACGCVAAVDIDAYDTCTHGCAYCYGTSSAGEVTRRAAGWSRNPPTRCSSKSASGACRRP